MPDTSRYWVLTQVNGEKIIFGPLIGRTATLRWARKQFPDGFQIATVTQMIQWGFPNAVDHRTWQWKEEGE